MEVTLSPLPGLDSSDYGRAFWDSGTRGMGAEFQRRPLLILGGQFEDPRDLQGGCPETSLLGSQPVG